MRLQRIAPLRLLIALGALLALAIPVAPVLGQGVTGTSASTSTVKVSIDSPSDGVDVQNGQKVNIGGWAVDTGRGATTGGAATSTGVDQVKVYLDGPMATGTLLGSATYGSARDDVAGLLGNNVYANSGFDYGWTPQNLGLGQHVLFIYAHSTVSDTWGYQSVSVNGPNFITPVPTAFPTPLPAPPAGNQQYPQQGQAPNPNQGPVTPYGGTYLNNGNGYGSAFGNGYGYMGGGYAGYGPPPMMGPMGPMGPQGFQGPQCNSQPFSSAAEYPVPCSSPRWDNGAPFLGF